MASLVFSRAYRSAICSMLALRTFVIWEELVAKEWATQNMIVINKVKPENKSIGYVRVCFFALVVCCAAYTAVQHYHTAIALGW